MTFVLRHILKNLSCVKKHASLSEKVNILLYITKLCSHNEEWRSWRWGITTTMYSDLKSKVWDLSHIVDRSCFCQRNVLLYIQMGDLGNISGNNPQYQWLFKYCWVLSFKKAKRIYNRAPNEDSGKTPYRKAWPFFFFLVHQKMLSKAKLALLRFYSCACWLQKLLLSLYNLWVNRFDLFWVLSIGPLFSCRDYVSSKPQLQRWHVNNCCWAVGDANLAHRKVPAEECSHARKSHHSLPQLFCRQGREIPVPIRLFVHYHYHS